ncbi:VOC family protein [Arthrobacter sp. Hor0625]|uniref:VOC family protein n=1 Tax=Arthrobacter sp. Hor0625 TaxID=3457358 RepID=UPI00403EF421
MPSQLASVAIDAVDPKVVADFWCAVLSWTIIEEAADEDGELISIGPRDNSAPSIDVIAVPGAKTVKNRLHFDLRADGVSTAEELERLLALGARRTDVGQGPDVSWVVLADPEGNEFCLLSRSVQDVEAEEARPAGPGQA